LLEQIKADDAEAKERVAAVEALGKVDGRRWPETEGVLIGHLRGDRSEQVRLAAAKAIQQLKGAGAKSAASLQIAIEGWDSDGFPAEDSPAVREAAKSALLSLPGRRK